VRDQPVFLALDGTVDAAYNGEKLRAISAGIDSSLWGILEDGPEFLDATVVKW